MKFEIGDIVRIAHDSNFQWQAGELGVGKVVEIDKYINLPYIVRSLHSRYKNNYGDSDLESAKRLIHPLLPLTKKHGQA